MKIYFKSWLRDQNIQRIIQLIHLINLVCVWILNKINKDIHKEFLLILIAEH